MDEEESEEEERSLRAVCCDPACCSLGEKEG